MAPAAIERTALEEDGGPDTRSVMDSELLQVEYDYISELLTMDMPKVAQKHLDIVKKEFPSESKEIHYYQAHISFRQAKYPEAIVNLERLIKMAQKAGLEYLDLEDLVANRKVHRLYEERIEALNAKLPSYQTIKKFLLLPRDFSVDGGELTPTLKLKRKVIYAKYQDRIERLYLNNGQGPDDREQTDKGGNS